MILRVRYTRVELTDHRLARVAPLPRPPLGICRNECLAKVPDGIGDTVALAAALLEAIFDIENAAEAIDHGLYTTVSWDGVELYCRTPCNRRGAKSLSSMTGSFNGYVDYVLVDARLLDKQPSPRTPRRLRILARCEPLGWTMLLDDGRGRLSEVAWGDDARIS